MMKLQTSAIIISVAWIIHIIGLSVLFTQVPEVQLGSFFNVDGETFTMFGVETKDAVTFYVLIVYYFALGFFSTLVTLTFGYIKTRMFLKEHAVNWRFQVLNVFATSWNILFWFIYIAGVSGSIMFVAASSFGWLLADVIATAILSQPSTAIESRKRVST